MLPALEFGVSRETSNWKTGCDLIRKVVRLPERISAEDEGTVHNHRDVGWNLSHTGRKWPVLVFVFVKCVNWIVWNELCELNFMFWSLCLLCLSSYRLGCLLRSCPFLCGWGVQRGLGVPWSFRPQRFTGGSETATHRLPKFGALNLMGPSIGL